MKMESFKTESEKKRDQRNNEGAGDTREINEWESEYTREIREWEKEMRAY